MLEAGTIKIDTRASISLKIIGNEMNRWTESICLSSLATNRNPSTLNADREDSIAIKVNTIGTEHPALYLIEHGDGSYA